MPPVNLPSGPLAPESVQSIEQTSVPTSLVRQMKVSKFAGPGGADITAALREVDSITIVHSNRTITYPILSRVEYTTYYWFTVDMPYDVVGNATTNATTILIPYHTQDFRNSDYNATINNATKSVESNYRMKADYNGGLLPANIYAITDGYAEKAQVQSYIENSVGLASSRYNGHQLTAAKLNEYTPGDVSFGATPVVANPQTYAAYFDWVGGTSPELIGYVAAHILYLIDQEGNIIPTTASEIELHNIEQTFGDGTVIDVDFENGEYITGDYAGTPLGALEGTQVVHRAARQAKAVVSTRSGTNAYDTSSITFSSSLDVQDFKFKAEGDSSFWNMVNINSTMTVPFDTQSIASEQTPAPYTYDAINYKLTMAEEPEIKIKYVASVYVQPFDDQTPNPGEFAEGYISLETIPSGSSTWTTLATGSKVSLSQYMTYGISTVVTNQLQFQDTQQLRVTFTNSGSSDFKLDIAPASWYAIPEFLTGEITVDISGTSSAWYQIAPNGTPVDEQKYWLAGHLDFNSVYGVAIQQDVANSGLDNFYLPFTVQPGDEIRFTDLEARTYKVVEVRTPEEAGRLFVRFDTAVDAQTLVTVSGNYRKFTLRRFVVNPAYLIYPGDKKSGNTSGGVILPKYITDDVKDKIQSAVLKIKGGN